MNINSVFNAPPRPDPTPRQEAAPRADDADSVDESREPSEKRVATRAEFSALMALLAGAGTKVRSDLLKQVPGDGASLIDTLLDGASLAAADGTEAPNAFGAMLPPGLAAGLPSSSQAADALRYGILKDSNATNGANDLDVLQAALTDAKNAATTHARGGQGDEHAHFNEIVGRILSRAGSSVDQLKARGEDRAADVREALDALLARAGTPSGLELASAPAAAAVAAANAALAAANAKSAADVSTPVKDTTALHPQLQQKLNRVIERMQNEYGNSVTVTETARSQERQDFLYEQGRTRPGNIVTWTQNSAHTRGDAVDVIVDGSYTNAEGFARLQRIAKEEGLRTLGVRDPGHLELAANDKGLEGALGTAAGTVAKSRELEATPLIATAAGQAGVARVAGVAGVARVAEAGSFDRRYTARVDAPNLAGATVVASGPASMNGQGHAFGRGERDEQGRPMNDGKKLGNARRESLGNPDASAFGGTPSNAALNTPTKTDATPTAAGVDAAERVANIQDLRDSAPAGSVSRLTLDIDAPNGGQDRITVDLRGSSVGTQINTDVASAERLRMRTAELQDALGRHGLESDSVRISGASRAETIDASRVAGGERDGLRLTAAQQSASNEGAMNQGQRDRSANAREWDRPQSPRQSRDEQQDTARDSAGQRGRRDQSNGSAYGSTS
jgi:hypothetical protein